MKLFLDVRTNLKNGVRVGLGDEDDDQGVLHLLHRHVLQHRLEGGHLQGLSRGET